jgi:hypothetical protein
MANFPFLKTHLTPLLFTRRKSSRRLRSIKQLLVPTLRKLRQVRQFLGGRGFPHRRRHGLKSRDAFFSLQRISRRRFFFGCYILSNRPTIQAKAAAEAQFGLVAAFMQALLAKNPALGASLFQATQL